MGGTDTINEGKSLFVLSFDGTLGKESQVVLANLSQILAAKMEEPISHVKGWSNGRITIAFARPYSRMIRRARVPIPLRTQ